MTTIIAIVIALVLNDLVLAGYFLLIRNDGQIRCIDDEVDHKTYVQATFAKHPHEIKHRYLVMKVTHIK